jgi:hypothetical protein
LSLLFLRIYKLECILLHNTFPSAKVFSFYIFTLLMFRKPNTTTINKNKTIHFIAIRPFSSRLYLDISRSFKCLKFSPIWSVWFEIDWCQFVSCFLYCENLFKSSCTHRFWTQIIQDLKFLYCVLINYLFKQVVDIF